MTIAFNAMNDADQDDLLVFLQVNSFPFHAGTGAGMDGIRRRVRSGRFWNDESQAFWINDGDTRLGLVVLEDLQDDTPVFDLRLANVHRGKGLGVLVLDSLCYHVFTTMPGILRFEGQTREDNFAMRKTFLRAGFIKEAHYRQAWPVAGGDPLASIAYAMLRSDWESGTTTALDWDDFSL